MQKLNLPVSTIRGLVIDAQSNHSFTNFPLDPTFVTPNHVIVKVSTGVINPSDVNFYRGWFPTKKTFPTIGGFEGAGQVIWAGSDAKALSDQRVAFMAMAPNCTGAFADYAIIHRQHCFVIPDKISDIDDACGGLVNPITAFGLLDVASKKNPTAIVHSGAAGGVGKTLIQICKFQNIPLINLVRKDENVTMLKSLGADYAFNTESANFEAEISECFAKLKPNVFFDCVSGELGTRILRKMGQGASLIAYGSLVDEPYGFTSKEIRFSEMSIEGFALGHYALKNLEKKDAFGVQAMEHLANGVLSLHISKKFALENYLEAFAYYKENQSLGKVRIGML